VAQTDFIRVSVGLESDVPAVTASMDFHDVTLPHF
jgi:hypothetical protein